MKTLGIVIFFISCSFGMYFQIKASSYLKDEFRNKGFHKFALFPNSLDDEAYHHKNGPKFRDLGMIILLLGFIIFVLFTSLS